MGKERKGVKTERSTLNAQPAFAKATAGRALNFQLQKNLKAGRLQAGRLKKEIKAE